MWFVRFWSQYYELTICSQSGRGEWEGGGWNLLILLYLLTSNFFSTGWVLNSPTFGTLRLFEPFLELVGLIKFNRNWIPLPLITMAMGCLLKFETGPWQICHLGYRIWILSLWAVNWPLCNAWTWGQLKFKTKIW